MVAEVHARGYQKLDESKPLRASMVDHYDQKLRDEGWEQIFTVQEDQQGAKIYITRESGAIRGVFVIGLDRRGLTLIRVTGDLAPEKLQRLVEQVTETAGHLGLLKQLEHNMYPRQATRECRENQWRLFEKFWNSTREQGNSPESHAHAAGCQASLTRSCGNRRDWGGTWCR